MTRSTSFAQPFTDQAVDANSLAFKMGAQHDIPRTLYGKGVFDGAVVTVECTSDNDFDPTDQGESDAADWHPTGLSITDAAAFAVALEPVNLDFNAAYMRLVLSSAGAGTLVTARII